MENEGYKLSFKKIILLVVTIFVFITGLIFYSLENSSWSSIQFIVAMGMSLIFAASIIADADEYKKKAGIENEDEIAEWMQEKSVLEVAKIKAEEERRVSIDELQGKQNEIDAANKRIKELEAELSEYVEHKNEVEENVEALNMKLQIGALIPFDSAKSTEIINIVDVANEVAYQYDKFAKNSNILIKVNSTVDSLRVKANLELIKIMFKNIVDNSIKYMRKEGQLIITLSAIEDMIFIVLKDNGKGLPVKEVEHIFELNYQGSNRVSGNGLGLTQAKAIVEYYQGTIYARSSENTGMGIYIQIPSH